MHILLGLIGVIFTIAMLVIRLNQASRAARELGYEAQGAKNFFRRRKFEKRAQQSILDSVEDPREAAAGMMIAIAEYRGALTQHQEDLIWKLMQDAFETTKPQTEQLLARGKWLSARSGDIETLLRRLSPAVQQQCTPEEKRDLVNMLHEVNASRGAAGDAENHAILRLRDKLGLR